MNGTPPQSFSGSRALSSPSSPSGPSSSSSSTNTSRVTSNETQPSLAVVSSDIPGSRRLGSFADRVANFIGLGDGPPGQVEQEVRTGVRKLFRRRDPEPEKTLTDDLGTFFAELLPPLQQITSDYCGPYPADLPVTVSDLEAAGFVEIDISQVVLSPEQFPPATEVWFPSGILATRGVVLGRWKGMHDSDPQLRVRFTNPEYAPVLDRHFSDGVGVLSSFGSDSRCRVWVNPSGAPAPLKAPDVARLETPAYLLISTDFYGGLHFNDGPHSMGQPVVCTRVTRWATNVFRFQFESTWAPPKGSRPRTEILQWGRPANQDKFVATKRATFIETPDRLFTPSVYSSVETWYRWETIINLEDRNIRLLRDPSVKVRQTAPTPVSVLKNSPLIPIMGEEEDMEPGMLGYYQIQTLGKNDLVEMEAFQNRSGTNNKGTYLMKVEEVFNISADSADLNIFNSVKASTRLVLTDTKGRRIRMSVTANSLPNLQLRRKAARSEDTNRLPEPEAEGGLATVSRFMPLRQKKGVTSPEAATYSQISALQPGDQVTIWALDRSTRNRSYQHATVQEVSAIDSDSLGLLLKDREGSLIAREVREDDIPILWIGNAARKREDTKSLSRLEEPARRGDNRTAELPLDFGGGRVSDEGGLITIQPRDSKHSDPASALRGDKLSGTELAPRDEDGLITLGPDLGPPPGDHNFAVAFAGGLRLECPVSQAKLLNASSSEPVAVTLMTSNGERIECVCSSAKSMSDERGENLILELQTNALQTNEGLTESLQNYFPLIDSVGSETSGSTRFRLNMELPR
jgi:hypothetical protein